MFPMWLKDYLADTSHLDATEHGIYHLLLYRYWLSNCQALPDDIAWLKRVAKCRYEAKLRMILNEYWTLRGGTGWHHARAEKVFRETRKRSIVSRENAKKRWKNKGSGNAGASSQQCSTSTSTKKEDLTSGIAQKITKNAASPEQPENPGKDQPGKSTTRPTYPVNFEALWEARPKRSGTDDKVRAFRAWNARQKEGQSAEAMLAGVKRYHAYCNASGKCGGEFVMMCSTFLGPADPPHFTLPWEPSNGRRGNGGRKTFDEYAAEDKDSDDRRAETGNTYDVDPNDWRRLDEPRRR